MSDVVPGWYADPSSPGTPQVRWWDGQQWSEHVSIPTAARVDLHADGTPLAGWGARLGAWVIDFALVGTVGILVSIPLYVSMFRAYGDWFEANSTADGTMSSSVNPFGIYADTWPQMVGLIAVGVGLNVLYQAVMLRWKAASLGKLALKLEVRRTTAPPTPLGWATIAKRVLLQYGAFQIAGVVYLNVLDGLWPLWAKKRQTLHDKVADTQVVRRG